MSYQLIRCKIKTLTPIKEPIFYIMNKVFKESIERRNEKKSQNHARFFGYF